MNGGVVVFIILVIIAVITFYVGEKHSEKNEAEFKEMCAPFKEVKQYNKVLSSLKKGLQRTDAPYIQGKVIVLWRNDNKGNYSIDMNSRAWRIYKKLDSKMQARTPDEVKTVVFIDSTEEILAKYISSKGNHVNSTRETIVITVVDLNAPAISGGSTLEAQYPKSGWGPLGYKYPPGGNYVSDENIVSYLNSLPAK